jgi:hypothetical protein
VRTSSSWLEILKKMKKMREGRENHDIALVTKKEEVKHTLSP